MGGKGCLRDKQLLTPLLVLAIWLGLSCFLTTLAGCTTLRPLAVQEVSTALPADPHTRLGRFAQNLPRIEAGASHFRLLESGRSALLARLALVERAEKSLDLQYYLFHADTSGRLLSEALLRAADRGVRVRVLLDDMDTARHEAAIIGLDAHPNIQIRLFNPFSVRRDNPLGRLAQFLGDGRLNHRMHNKLFLADSVLAVTGGRNIGDEYFQVDHPVAFRDLDVLAAGPVVADMAAGFDAYWNSAYAISVRAIPEPERRSHLLARVRQALEQHLAELEQDMLFYTMGLDVLGGDADAEFSPWLPGRAEFITDAPDKLENARPAAQLPLGHLLGQGHRVQQELLISSPYFVPGPAGVDILVRLREQGARVRILTNSIGATDVLVVHAGYAKYRLPLLQAGIELHELKPTRVKSNFFRRLAGGSSRTSLHGKVMVYDRQSVYIGSMNLDPRSIFINTEAGLLIQGPLLAERTARFLEREMTPQASYRLGFVQEAQDGLERLVWREGERVHEQEPRAGFWSRMLIRMLSFPELEAWL